MTTLDELKLLRAQICEQMASIDKTLSEMKRSAPGRGALVARKQLLLAQIAKVKVQLTAARGCPHDAAREPVVSDHALVRWLERKHGIDVARLKAMILTDAIKEAMREGREYWADEAVVYALKENTVVTVMPAAWKYGRCGS